MCRGDNKIVSAGIERKRPRVNRGRPRALHVATSADDCIRHEYQAEEMAIPAADGARAEFIRIFGRSPIPLPDTDAAGRTA
jgi:hypothetical protein